MTTETIHVLPVGFDIHRLTAPLTSDEFDADRVVLVHSTEDDIEADHHQSEAERLVANAFEQTKKNIENFLDIPVETRTVPGFTEYRQLYSAAYDLLRELSNEGIVYVNVSSVPLSAASAFVNAEAVLSANASGEGSGVKKEFPAQYTDRGDRVHTYYIRPEQYLETELYRLNRTTVLDSLDHIEAHIEGFYEEVESGVFYGLATPVQQRIETLGSLLEQAEEELQSASPEQRGADWEVSLRRCNELLEEWEDLGPDEPFAGRILRNMEKE